jgi:hypothetical protein
MEEPNKNINKITFSLVEVDNEIITPKVTYNLGKKFINWGAGRNNNYDKILLDLYNYDSTSYHKACIEKKINLSLKDGYNFSSSDAISQNIIANSDTDKFITEAYSNFIIFNGFSSEIIRAKEGNNFAKFANIPLTKIRKGIEVEGEVPFFALSRNFQEYRKKENEIIYMPSLDKTLADKKMAFYFIGYNPQNDGVYPIPTYSNAIRNLLLTDEIMSYKYNSAKNGYMQDFMLNFATGIPDESVMDEQREGFKKTYEGAKNKQTIMLSWSEGQDQKPEFIPIPKSQEWKRFLEMNESEREEIITAHGIPPALMILTPGKLASSDERLELNQELMTSTINPTKLSFQKGLNQMFKEMGVAIKFEFNY